MSNPNLPAELLDHIVDHLHDTEDALINCCLVSKSWIPRTRKHLFADVWFEAKEDLESWKETFPDPSTSPGRYTNTLIIDCPHVVTAADAEAGGWIRDFSHVVHLKLDGRPGPHHGYESEIFLVPLQGFSPFVKSLKIYCIALPISRIFGLILSFPLLEDLTAGNCSEVTINEDDGSDGLPTIFQPLNPPVFTGSLRLTMTGLASIGRRLLSLPGGIHFRKFRSTWDRGEDIPLVAALVERCSHTLESLDIGCDPLAGLTTIDLSKATKLRDAVFRPESFSVKWITTALQTTIPKHRELQRISICVPRYSTFPDNVEAIMRSTTHGEWMDLDRLLVQFWESHLTDPKVIRMAWEGRKPDVRGYVECLLPELTKRGVIDLVE